MQRCSTLLLIREVQIKTKMRYHFTHSGMVKMKKRKKKVTSFGKNKKKLESLYAAFENVQKFSHCEKLSASQKVKYNINI